MTRTLLAMRFSVAVLFLAFSLFGLQNAAAVEEHHAPDATGKEPSSTEPSSPGMMTGAQEEGAHGMMRMMEGHKRKGGKAMTGQNMRGMMGTGMMRMMMSHMMGGSGAMGKIMRRMGSDMMASSVGFGGLAHDARMLENLNLTPEQWDQVHTLARNRLDEMAELWARRMKLEIELASLRWDKELNPQHVKQVFVKEAEAEADLLLAGFEYLQGLKGILTPDQFKKLESQGF